ncbi:FABP family protein [Amycolatopsis panacis]|uniref:Peroxynitrite isomerase n=1 Tax=Amycolatopsis panacis TaxID=2340917 RepID=A0A419HN10_9PSEU|nr:FABP family protein [Amycolatopsis panacis]RJQ77527.1 FABP family protein [Amycolatopsis panacis]
MTTSGDEAIAAAEERAASTRDRNLPLWDDLPIPNDTANLRKGEDLNEACLALLPMVGVWRGEGEISYPTIDGPIKFAQQLTVSHDGRPFLIHEARSWLVNEDGSVKRPAARETGFWRPQEDDTLELLLSHSSGVVELFYGKPRNQTSWELGTDAVIRTATAKEVTGAQRLYGLINGDLGYVEERAMMGQEMQPHASALLRRVVG